MSVASSIGRSVAVRAAGLAMVVALTTAWVSYMARTVPLNVYKLPAPLVPSMTRLAISAFIAMLAVDAVIIVLAWRRHKAQPARPTGAGPAMEGLEAILRKPRQNGLLTVAVTAAASLAVFSGLGLVGLPLWFMAAAALIPWLPLYISEAAWQYRHYGAFALFGTLVLLQLGHLSEHIVQNVQLLMTGGKLAASRGVFGQLDVETVHFYWNIGIWLGTGALLYRYGGRNVWLVVSFIAASLHSVEHLYMYWLYFTHSAAYVLGGWNGILGQGGLVGSPLARPYLHLVYNVIEVAPFVLAYLDESRRVFDRTAELAKLIAAPTSVQAGGAARG